MSRAAFVSNILHGQLNISVDMHNLTKRDKKLLIFQLLEKDEQLLEEITIELNNYKEQKHVDI